MSLADYIIVAVVVLAAVGAFVYTRRHPNDCGCRLLESLCQKTKRFAGLHSVKRLSYTDLSLIRLCFKKQKRQYRKNALLSLFYSAKPFYF